MHKSIAVFCSPKKATYLTLTCSKLTTETLEKVKKYVQSYQNAVNDYNTMVIFNK